MLNDFKGILTIFNRFEWFYTTGGVSTLKRPFKNPTNYQSFTREKDENKIEEKIQKDNEENKPQTTEE